MASRIVKSSADEWCVHYRGVNMQGTCEAGVSFAMLRSARPDGEWIPCFQRNADIPCVHRRFPTPEEIEARHERQEAELVRWESAIANNVCPHCDQPMRKTQVGRCVYARPCGHRLYQGTVND